MLFFVKLVMIFNIYLIYILNRFYPPEPSIYPPNGSEQSTGYIPRCFYYVKKPQLWAAVFCFKYKLFGNGAYRAGRSTRAAFNAGGFVDCSFAVLFGNSAHGAGGFASTAVNANIRIYFISHGLFLLNLNYRSVSLAYLLYKICF